MQVSTKTTTRAEVDRFISGFKNDLITSFVLLQKDILNLSQHIENGITPKELKLRIKEIISPENTIASQVTKTLKHRLDAIQEKTGWTGQSYQDLISKVIDVNTHKISTAIGRVSKTDWNKALKKITTKEKQFILPDISDVLPKRSVFTRKSAIDGKLITDTLKDRLNKDLRESMQTFTLKTGEQNIIRRRGTKAGLINPKVVKGFEGKITETFKNYVKKDPRYNMPANIHTIAVTETRKTINDMKNRYAEKLNKKNPDLVIQKEWVHNRSLSKTPRLGHLKANGMRVDIDKDFILSTYKMISGKWIYTGIAKMKYPHDPMAEAGETIGCNCEAKYIMKKN